MQLHCVKCGAGIVAPDIDLGTGLAKCATCNNVFNFKDRLRAGDARPPVQILPQPPQMRTETSGGRTRIWWRWFNWTYVAALGGCIVWDGLLINWYSMAFTQNAPSIAVFFPLIHVAVGISMTYNVIAGFLNRTVIDVDDTTLSVRHGPVPWWGHRYLSAGQITQLFCESTWSRNNNQPGLRYQLCATMGEGHKVRLVGGLKYLGEARFLEQQIEQRLGIKPQAVVGECNE